VANATSASADDFEHYRPPELEATGRWWEVCESESALVFALAATLYSAADHGLPDDQEPSLNEEMELLLSTMADDDPDERADLDTIQELAAAGLMLCLDSEGSDEADAIIARLASEGCRPHAVVATAYATGAAGGPSLNTVGPSAAHPHALRALHTDVPSDWEVLLSELQSTRPLKDASLRELAEPTRAHISRIAQPATYITPHEALIGDISAQRWALKQCPPPPRPGPAATASRPAGDSSAPADADQTPHPSKRGHNRKLLKPCTSVADLLADWNPERQVELGFLAEAAKPPSQRAAPVVVVAPPPLPAADPGPTRASSAQGPATHIRRRLSADPLIALIRDTEGHRTHPQKEPQRSGVRSAASSGSGSGSGSGSSVTTKGGISRNSGSAAPSRRPTVSTLDKARSLFRRQSSETSLWSATRAAARKSSSSSMSPPTSPGGSGEVTKISLADWQHIRMSLVKAELEDLRDSNPSQVGLITQHKACAACGVRFGRFKWGRKCVVCSLSNCSACTFKFDAPVHMRAQLRKLDADSPKGPAICADCKSEMTAQSLP
jgi:hypothetical protein